MDLPVWGIGVIAVYSLLQIPAVILVARYCEVDSEDLPTPPMRARWRSGNPQQTRDSEMTKETTSGRDSADSDAPNVTPGPKTLLARPSTPAATGESGDVRCSNCGTRNDPAFIRCRHCVAAL